MQGEPEKSCCWPLITTSGDMALGIGVVDGGAPQYSTSFLSGDCGIVTLSRVPGLNLLDTQWHHMAATYTANNTKQLFVDGELVLEQDCGDQSENFITSRKFTLGRSFTGATLDGSFDGWLDETRLWTVARSQEQIRDSMHRTLRPDEFQHIFFYYNYDEQFADIASLSESLDPVPSTQDPKIKYKLIDKGEFHYDIEMGTESLGDEMDLRRVGQIVHSTAPVLGGPQLVYIKSPAASLPTPPSPPSRPRPSSTPPSPSSSPLPAPARADSSSTTVLYNSTLFMFGAHSSSFGSDNEPLTVTIYSLPDPLVSFLELVHVANHSVVSLESLPLVVSSSDTFMVRVLNGSDSYTATKYFIEYSVYDSFTMLDSPTAYVVIDMNINRKPVAGNAGGMLYCDGSSFAYAKDFVLPASWHSGFSGTLPYTIEWWGYFFSQDNEGNIK